jgi:hypothetical protein
VSKKQEEELAGNLVNMFACQTLRLKAPSNDVGSSTRGRAGPAERRHPVKAASSSGTVLLFV